MTDKKYTITQFATYWIPKSGVGRGQFVFIPAFANQGRKLFSDWEMGLIELGKDNWQIAALIPSTDSENHLLLMQRQVEMDTPPIFVNRELAQDD